MLAVQSTSAMPAIAPALPTTSAFPLMADDQPSSSSGGFTLAAELLDMPMLPETYTAKDIDAAWFLDGAASLSDDFNALFQVSHIAAQDTNIAVCHALLAACSIWL